MRAMTNTLANMFNKPAQANHRTFDMIAPDYSIQSTYGQLLSADDRMRVGEEEGKEDKTVMTEGRKLKAVTVRQ